MLVNVNGCRRQACYANCIYRGSELQSAINFVYEYNLEKYSGRAEDTMAGNRFTQNEQIQNLSKVRTPMTPDNKYKRIGLLILGLALIIAGVIILVSSCNDQNSTAQQPLFSNIYSEQFIYEQVL